MLAPMAKVHVIGHRRHLDEVLALLHGLEVLHLVDVTDDPGVRLPPLHVDEAHVREIEDARYLKTRVDAVLALVPNPPRPKPDTGEPPTVDLDRLRGELDASGPEIEELVRRLDELTREREILPRHLESLRRLLPLVPALIEFDGYETTAMLIDARHAAVLGELHAALVDEIGANFEIISDEVDPDTVGAVLVFPRDEVAVVHRLLGNEQLAQVRLPTRFERMPFRDAITAMERRLTELPADIETTSEAIDDFVRRHAHWATCAERLGRRLDQMGVIRHLGATAHTFVISGWVPQRDVDAVRRALADEVGPEVMVEAVPAAPGDTPPVLMENPAPARPFEFLVNLLAVPRYGAIDPTVLMALFLPLFFGIMLGDVVYGAVLFILALFVWRRFRHRPGATRDLAGVFLFCAAWAIVWGVVYGEFLGDLGHRWFGMEPIWINREEALVPLLLFALAIGAAHVLLGLGLGIHQAIRLRQRHVIVERAATMAALVALFLIAGTAAGALPDAVMTPAAAVVVVGLVVLMVSGGVIGLLTGPLDLLGAVGNVLSYLRIAAIGLASVYLARVANELGSTGPVLVGIVVAALFHTLNLALGAFSPTIQALRLHYVEFFGKFYEPGGDPFRPFGPGTSRPTKTSTPTT